MYSASAALPEGNVLEFALSLLLLSRPSIQQSSRWTYCEPASFIPLVMKASAMLLTTFSFTPLHADLFQESQPVGGVAPRIPLSVPPVAVVPPAVAVVVPPVVVVPPFAAIPPELVVLAPLPSTSPTVLQAEPLVSERFNSIQNSRVRPTPLRGRDVTAQASWAVTSMRHGWPLVDATGAAFPSVPGSTFSYRLLSPYRVQPWIREAPETSYDKEIVSQKWHCRGNAVQRSVLL